jgi:hypothetical protein
MKLLLFFLFSAAVLAQEFHPDTIVYKNNNSIAGKIIGISNSRVEIEYSSDKIRSESINELKKISVGKLGLVYFSGFTVDVDAIKNYLSNRTEEANVPKLLDDKKLSQGQTGINRIDTIYAEPEISGINMKRKQRWSFGVLLIPYYSGKIYDIGEYYYQDPVYSSSLSASQYLITSSATNEINMEAQLSFALSDQVCLTFDGTYTAASYENRSENHQRNTGGGYTYDSGNLYKNDLTLLDFSLGIKYYLNNLMTEKVSVYFLAGIGKQFASAEETDETLFQQPQPGVAINEDNRNEFLEDANSPFHFNLGFGAEYLFNESLSLTSNIRFLYSRISAKYDSRQISDYQTVSNSTDYKTSDFITRIGVGLNFYF